MYGYVVNIESVEPLRRLSITEVGADEIVGNKSIVHQFNIESNTNEYTFSLSAVPPIQSNENNVQNVSRPMIMPSPMPAILQTTAPQPMFSNNPFDDEPDSAVIPYNKPVNGYPNDNNINGMVKNNRVAPLQPFGSDSLVSTTPIKHTLDDFEVIWHKLSYTLPIYSTITRSISLTGVSLKTAFSRLHILKKLNGFFRSSEVLAIMGPSGAGKSTLLEIICGRRRRGVDGEVRIRGVDEIKVGFVPQDNHLMELLTVKESFIFASKIINVNDPHFDHNGLTDKLIRRFGLNSIVNTKVKRCSGGQRKRLSIAMEIISRPNILILDEPTTGLDSPSATHIIAILKELVSDKQRPTAIVTTIHQPSVRVFNAFHRIYVLSAHGKCIYHGTPQNLVPTFNKVGIQVDPYTSPADYIIEVAAGDYGQVPIKKMAAETEGQEMERLVTTDTKTLASVSKLISHPFWPHFQLLFVRTQMVLYRDPFLTIIRLSFAILAAISLSILFGPDVGRISGCPPRELELYATPTSVLTKKFESDLNMIMQNVCLLFLGIMIGFISGLTPTLLNFPREMHVFHKEYHNGWYSCITYYIAKVMSDIPMQVITPMIYILITYFYSHQPLEVFRFLTLVLLSIMLALVAQSIGECASACFMENQNAAVVVGGLIPLPMILFGGFLVKISRMPRYLQPLSWGSILRFGFEAMLVSTYGFDRCEYAYEQFLASVNVSAITKPLWAQSLPIMMDFVKSKRNGVLPGKQGPVSDEESLKRLYEVFAGGVATNGKGIDLNTSLILTYFEIEDYTLFTSLIILCAYMIGLKVMTYYVLLAKLHSTK